MSSSSSTTEKNQQQLPRTSTNEQSVLSQPLADLSIAPSSQTPPVLAASQPLIQNDHENNLEADIDEIIYNFLSRRLNGQNLTDETVLKWTRNDMMNHRNENEMIIQQKNH
jgi:hypothetical protein